MPAPIGSIVSRREYRAARPVVVLIVLLPAVLAGAAQASAYWGGAGSGSATAITGTLASPVEVTVPGTSASEVLVTWSPGAGGVAPAGYYVTRHDGDTSTPACGTSPTVLIQDTSCTDNGVPNGQYSFMVTAVYRSWTAPSAASGSVIVVGADVLVFTTQVVDTGAGALISPPVTVALQTVDGMPFASAGVLVTIAVGTNPGGGILTGGTTATTDATGAVTFDSVSIDEPGIGYTLTATSSGLASATSNPFTVTVPSPLGTAQTYSVLAGTAVVSTGVTTLSGDLGVSPGTSVVGFGPGTVGGELHAGDANAAAAQAALVDAYGDLASRTAGGELAGDLNGLTLNAGTYHSTAALALTGTLTLDAQGDPDALFIIQVGAAFNTAAASRVTLTNGAQASKVFWVVASAAGTDANSFLSGTIVAQGAITLGAGTELIGRALSRGAVTLDANTIRFTDALPAAITIDGGASALTKDTSPTITGTSSAAASSPITVTVAAQTLSTTVGPAGTWGVTTAALTAGVHQIVAKVRETNGNGNDASQTLTVEVNPPTVNLDTAQTYSALAGTAVVSTGVTTLSGDLGVSPGTSVVGFGPGTYDGALHAGDLPAAAAQSDFLAALNDASSRTPHTQITGDLGTRTFHIGVHHANATLALTGTVTLDAEGNSDAVFIFQTDAAFNTAAASTVSLINGAQASNVFWVVTGAVGVGANSTLAGNILARGAITLGANTSLTGQALSRGTVTLAGNILTGVAPAPAARLASPADPQKGPTETPDQSTATEPAPPATLATDHPDTTAGSKAGEPTELYSPASHPAPSATNTHPTETS